MFGGLPCATKQMESKCSGCIWKWNTKLMLLCWVTMFECKLACVAGVNVEGEGLKGKTKREKDGKEMPAMNGAFLNMPNNFHVIQFLQLSIFVNKFISQKPRHPC